MSKTSKYISQYVCLRLDEPVTVVYKQENDNTIKFMECRNKKQDICNGCYLYNLLKRR